MLVIVALIAAGSIYQWWGAKQDRNSEKPVGNLYEVAGHRMHLYTEGEGETTVVFASGMGTPSPYADFSPLYPLVAKFAKVAVYDRFGYGFSDMTGDKRDIDAITDEIHELLQKSGQKPPYVFVGHSLGSLETIRYAQRYPNEVKGIVLIEGGSPEYYAKQPELTVVPRLTRVLRVTGALRTLYHFPGFVNWVNSESNKGKLLSDDMRALSRRALLLRAGNKDVIGEVKLSRENATKILSGPKPLSIPMVALTADYFGDLDKDKAWRDTQRALPEWSTDGKQIVVKDSSHYIYAYRPDVVAGEIEKLARR